MIRYDVTLKKLEKAAEGLSHGWVAKAAACTDKCRAQGAYVEQGSIWGDIKEAYMTLQHNKCCYCERKLASRERVEADGTLRMIGPGKVEHDVEHFRPKSRVRKWPTPKIATERGIHYDFAIGEGSELGYYLLAFHPLNYATSCKTCNTPLKSDYFPVAAKRKTKATDPARLRSEKALLIYPLGAIDDDPEALIAFDGYLPRPAGNTAIRQRRAKLTIDFLELDTREELLRERASAMVDMLIAFESLSSNLSQPVKDLAQKSLEGKCSPRSAHTSCCKCFLNVLKTDLPRARELAAAAQAYLDSES